MKKSEIKAGNYYAVKFDAGVRIVLVDLVETINGINHFHITDCKMHKKIKLTSTRMFLRKESRPFDEASQDTTKVATTQEAEQRLDPMIGNSTTKTMMTATKASNLTNSQTLSSEDKESSDPTMTEESVPSVQVHTIDTTVQQSPILVSQNTSLEEKVETTPVYSPLSNNSMSNSGTIQKEQMTTVLTSGFAKHLAAQNTTDAPHVQLKALAGTGKTTSCVQGLMKVKGIGATITPSPQQEAFWNQLALGKNDSVRISAFNNTITDEVDDRIKACGLDKHGCEAIGVHKLGFRIFRKYFGYKKPSEYAVIDRCAEVLGGEFHDLKKKPGMLQLMSNVDELVGLCKQNMCDPTAENLDQLISHYDVEVNGSRARLNDLVPQVLEKCKVPGNKIHFDDMIWLPLVLNLPVPRVDLQIIDEAQDLNRMQQELIYKGGNRVVIVGDPFQAIYGFAGADSESMNRMVKTLGATPRGIVELPLTVTRRCGKAIVQEAKKLVPEYEAHESCPEGMVAEAKYPIQGEGEKRRTLPWEQTYCRDVRDGAMILCRVNAPLVSECFRFLKKRIKANILGRKIGEGLVTLVEKSKADSVDQLRGWLEDWLTKEQESEMKKKYPSEARQMALQDKHDCVVCFTEDCTYTSEVIRRIKEVFTDSKDTRGIRLASIHKSKGLEADQVFFLQPKGGECPHPMAKSEWQREQEKNLYYVACTRAINELWMVY